MKTHEIEIGDLLLPDFPLTITYNEDGEITLPADWKDQLKKHMDANFDELCQKVTDKQNDLEFWKYPAQWEAEEKAAHEEAEEERQMQEEFDRGES